MFLAAAYLRLIALGDGVSTGPDDANRLMPGAMSQTSNFRKLPNKNNFNSVLSNEVMTIVNEIVRHVGPTAPRRPVRVRAEHLQPMAARAATGREEATGVTRCASTCSWAARPTK